MQQHNHTARTLAAQVQGLGHLLRARQLAAARVPGGCDMERRVGGGQKERKRGGRMHPSGSSRGCAAVGARWRRLKWCMSDQHSAAQVPPHSAAQRGTARRALERLEQQLVGQQVHSQLLVAKRVDAGGAAARRGAHLGGGEQGGWGGGRVSGAPLLSRLARAAAFQASSRQRPLGWR